MTNAQCRMARAGLNVSLAALGDAAGVRPMTISKFERGGTVLPATVEKLRQWFVAQGVEFINGGKSAGVKVPRA
jgi:transcriptional regulator with XRE-family HTH domain